MPFSYVASAVGIASGVSGLLGGGDSGGGGGGGGSPPYDPFSGSRGQYATKLNDLMNGKPKDVNASVMNQPGYMGGLQAGQRGIAAGLARTGQTQSGAEQIAYGNENQSYFQQSYQDLYNKYFQLSGAGQSPASGANAGLNQQQFNAQQQQSNFSAIAQGAAGLSGLFGGNSNNGGSSGRIDNYQPNNSSFYGSSGTGDASWYYGN